MDRRNAYAGFALFGAFWGVWGASLPEIRDRAAVTDGELGAALLFIGLGALPAMLLAGKAVDRRRERATAVLLAVFGIAGVAVVLLARDFAGLALSLALLGAASGAADVAINTTAGAAQRAHGGAVVARSHGTFSAAVVIASLTTGAIHAAALPTPVPFAAVAVAALAVAAMMLAAPPAGPSPPRDDEAAPASGARRPGLAPLLVIGGLGALAFAVENAHQSWSALYLRDEVGAGAALAAAGPAVFAGVVAATRFATGPATGRRPRLTLVAGAVLAGAGTALLGSTGTLAVALAGLALAAAGTAVLFPTLIVVVTAMVPDRVRGTATSAVTTVAYLGFLGGPVYVGAWADRVGLPGAMLAVAALAVVLAVLAAVAVRPRVPAAA